MILLRGSRHRTEQERRGRADAGANGEHAPSIDAGRQRDPARRKDPGPEVAAEIATSSPPPAASAGNDEPFRVTGAASPAGRVRSRWPDGWSFFPAARTPARGVVADVRAGDRSTKNATTAATGASSSTVRPLNGFSTAGTASIPALFYRCRSCRARCREIRPSLARVTPAWSVANARPMGAPLFEICAPWTNVPRRRDPNRTDTRRSAGTRAPADDRVAQRRRSCLPRIRQPRCGPPHPRS